MVSRRRDGERLPGLRASPTVRARRCGVCVCVCVFLCVCARTGRALFFCVALGKPRLRLEKQRLSLLGWSLSRTAPSIISPSLSAPPPPLSQTQSTMRTISLIAIMAALAAPALAGRALLGEFVAHGWGTGGSVGAHTWARALFFPRSIHRRAAPSCARRRPPIGPTPALDDVRLDVASRGGAFKRRIAGTRARLLKQAASPTLPPDLPPRSNPWPCPSLLPGADPFASHAPVVPLHYPPPPPPLQRRSLPPPRPPRRPPRKRRKPRSPLGRAPPR